MPAFATTTFVVTVAPPSAATGAETGSAAAWAAGSARGVAGSSDAVRTTVFFATVVTLSWGAASWGAAGLAADVGTKRVTASAIGSGRIAVAVPGDDSGVA